MAGLRLTREHRAAQLALRARSVRGLLTLWPAVDPEDLSGTIETFTQAAVLLALSGHDESSGISARYLAFLRSAERIPGNSPGFVAPRPLSVRVSADLRGAALKGIIDARKAGLSPLAAKDRGFVRVAGTLIKRVLAGGRMTVIGNVDRDRRALGWERVTSGDPCAFCRMLAGRGAVYKSQGAADFQPHETCGCVPEPIYRDGATSEQNAEYAREFTTAQAWARQSGTMSRGTSNDALNNLRRWLANGKPDPGARTATASPAPTPNGGASDAG
jgi:hypothetical protein